MGKPRVSPGLIKSLRKDWEKYDGMDYFADIEVELPDAFKRQVRSPSIEYFDSGNLSLVTFGLNESTVYFEINLENYSGTHTNWYSGIEEDYDMSIDLSGEYKVPKMVDFETAMGVLADMITNGFSKGKMPTNFKVVSSKIEEN